MLAFRLMVRGRVEDRPLETESLQRYQLTQERCWMLCIYIQLLHGVSAKEKGEKRGDHLHERLFRVVHPARK